MADARVEEYGSGYLIRPPDEQKAAWLGAFGPPGDLTGSPAPDLLLEDHWTSLCVRPVSEAGRRWVAGTLMRARRRFGRVVAADPRRGGRAGRAGRGAVNGRGVTVAGRRLTVSRSYPVELPRRGQRARLLDVPQPGRRPRRRLKRRTADGSEC